MPLFAAIASPTSAFAASAEFHIAPAGDDRAAGTQAAPFATLERARDAAREFRRTNPGAAVTVWLQPGEYPREKAFELGAADSGTAEAPTRFAAAPGGRVTLWGARRIERAWFSPCTDAAILTRIIEPAARPKVLQVDLRSHGWTDLGEISRRGYSKNNFGLLPPPQLSIASERMRLARWPNPDESFPQFLHPYVKARPGVVGRAGIVDGGPTAADADFRDRGPVYRYAFERPRHWAGAKEIWFDGVFNESWEWSYNRVASIDTAAKTITMRYGEATGVGDRYAGDFFLAENLIEELDQPGEYWIDRDTGILYLIPPATFDRPDTSITITALAEPMVRLRDASHITLVGLDLASGRSSGIVARGGEGLRVERCVVRDFNEDGVSLAGKRHAVKSCRVRGVGGFGVVLEGGDLLTLEPGGSSVEDCEVLDVAWHHRVYHGSITLRGVGQRASHNRLRGNPHLTVSVAGNDHLIEFNDIGRVCTEFTDMGAIYIHTGYDLLQRGTVIRHNFIHDIGDYPQQMGVYPDNGTMGVTIEGNLFFRIGGATPATRLCRAVNNNSGGYIAVRDNLFVDCPLPYVLSAHSGGKNHDNQKARWEATLAQTPLAALPHLQRYPELAKFWEEERRYPVTNTFERNVIWNPRRPLTKSWQRGKGEPTPLTDGAAREYDGLQIRENWVASVNPGFVDLTKGDFTLAPGAELFRHIPGFKAIPFREVGPRGPVGVPAATAPATQP